MELKTSNTTAFYHGSAPHFYVDCLLTALSGLLTVISTCLTLLKLRHFFLYKFVLNNCLGSLIYLLASAVSNLNNFYGRAILQSECFVLALLEVLSLHLIVYNMVAMVYYKSDYPRDKLARLHLLTAWVISVLLTSVFVVIFVFGDDDEASKQHNFPNYLCFPSLYNKDHIGLVLFVTLVCAPSLCIILCRNVLILNLSIEMEDGKRGGNPIKILDSHSKDEKATTPQPFICGSCNITRKKNSGNNSKNWRSVSSYMETQFIETISEQVEDDAFVENVQAELKQETQGKVNNGFWADKPTNGHKNNFQESASKQETSFHDSEERAEKTVVEQFQEIEFRENPGARTSVSTVHCLISKLKMEESLEEPLETIKHMQECGLLYESGVFFGSSDSNPGTPDDSIQHGDNLTSYTKSFVFNFLFVVCSLVPVLMASLTSSQCPTCRPSELSWHTLRSLMSVIGVASSLVFIVSMHGSPCARVCRVSAVESKDKKPQREAE